MTPFGEAWSNVEAPAPEHTPLVCRWRPLSKGTSPAWLGQALKFLAVGVLNTLVDAGLYFALTRWLGLAALPALAKGISYSAGVLNSFYWNRSWTFHAKSGDSKTFALFVLTSLVALAINAAVMHLCLNGLNWSESVSLVLAIGVTFLWNFVLSKFVVFRKKKV